jgi:hypothetical protein
MMIKASKLAMAIAVIGSFAFATAIESSAPAPACCPAKYNYAPNGDERDWQTNLDRDYDCEAWNPLDSALTARP